MNLRRVLVANRGEIALRVFRTCRRLGIHTIAIFTDTDRHAPHVRAADEAVEVSSYLDIVAVVAAAMSARADAVHPGYGFLSERAPFARALSEAGIALVGPTAEVMDLMGRKDAAREVAVAAGVPVVPTGDQAAFPILVKAASGGGGKGMRIVRSAVEYDDAVAAAKREALSAFGDDTLIIEKYVEHGRHIEVQIFGDTHGNVMHLFERDCSTQRRHQKVLEEAPAPTLDEPSRKKIAEAAVDLAKHVGYTNAGTVEFLLDADTGEFYFLEMNTRLQVEHPVTELICGGIDLVEQQLRVTSGEEIALSDLTVHGHAIEARVYAEDSFGGFLPQAGTATLVRWPDGVRVDAALESGQVVSTSFDPMLGKLIAHGPDRESARAALIQALDETAILGLTTNAGFLRTLLASDDFRDATIDTAWLDHTEIPAPDEAVPRILAAWTKVFVDGLTAVDGPFRPDGFRLGADPAPVHVELGDWNAQVDRPHGKVTLAGQAYAVRQISAEQHVMVLEIDGVRESGIVHVTRGKAEVSYHGQRFSYGEPDRLADHGTDVGDGTVLAPMPGTVLKVTATIGQRVAEGDVLGMMEAMKMELNLKAPFAGTVTEVKAKEGDTVALGATLFFVDKES